MSKWYNEAVFYHMYPLGLVGAPTAPTGPTGLTRPTGPTEVFAVMMMK